MDGSKVQTHRISVSGHGNKVVTCLQHDDEKVVTGVDDKCILIYSTQTGQLMKVLEGHEGGVWALKYTGNTLVTGSTDRTVRVWNMKTRAMYSYFRGHFDNSVFGHNPPCSDREKSRWRYRVS